MPALPATPIAVGRTAEVFAWEDGTVLKLYREWAPRRWLEHEARIARIVHAAGLAVPAPGAIVEVNGRAGMIYERLDGPHMFEDMLRHALLTTRRSARQAAELQATMHKTTVAELPSYRQQLQRSIRQAQKLPESARTDALRRLDALPDGDRLCHGDFHPANILMTRRGPVVIDWMTAARGNPLTDVARTVLLMRMGPPLAGLKRWGFDLLARAFLFWYVRRYAELRVFDQSELAAWLPVVAAARFSENIEWEQQRLFGIINAGMARKGGTET
jgi:aminoglycoside phosphotransferase (APT) family kinase protein